MAIEPLIHPLSQTYAASPDTNNEETSNTWYMASMIANVAVGRIPGDRDKSASACVELAKVSDHAESQACERLLKEAQVSDAALMLLIGVLNSGLEVKLDEAFG